MNPERNKTGMTVNALLQTGMYVSAIIPVVLIALLGFIANQHIQIDSTFILWIVACAITVLIGILITNYFVQREVKSRILSLVDVCRDYTGGERTIRATVSGDDEFAMLTMSLNTLLDNQGTSQGSTPLGTSSGDAAALQAQIEKLLQEVSAVGDGDLRVQAEVTPDTLGVLADSFNYMIEELAKVVGRVQTTAVQITNATRRILDRSAELAQASETQVGQISHTTEAVEALAVFIQNVARNAQLSVEVAQEALRNANSGQQSVRQTIDGMMLIRENVQETSKKIKRLGERSNEIGEIVRIIEDIADQTNLLALNAAIQSAMAGEHGRGFAVVADEIRLLAERSTESTKRIATLVKSIQGDTYEAVVAMEDSTQEVVKGSQLADEAGRSLNSIYSAVERQAQMIESIARAANEQTSVSEAVAIAMGQISEITHQTNIGTQEAAGSVTYLAELSDQLRASVATFRLPDHGNEGAFAGITSITELPHSNANQMFPAALVPGAEGEWNQNFSSNFPPAPELGGSASLVALPSHSGQFAFNDHDFGQPAFGGMSNQPRPSAGGQPAFANQQSFGKQPQPSFANQQDFGVQAFGNPSSFGNQPGQQSLAHQSFNNQPGFGEFDGFDSYGFEEAQFGNIPPSGFGGQQGFSPGSQLPNSQSFNSGSLSQPQGQPQASRPRWQRGPQQNPGQSQFGQDQTPFPTSGHNG